MNNTFDINRFILLLRRQIQEFGKIFLIALAVIVGVLGFSYWYYGPSGEITSEYQLTMSFRYGLLPGLGLLFIGLSSSTYFASYGNKARTISELMLPSSKQEKFLSGILLSGVVPFITLIITYFLVDIIMVNYLQSKLDTDLLIPTITELVNPGEFLRFYIIFLILIPLLTNSVFLLGSIYFEKYQFLKTAISFIVISIIMGYMFNKTAGLLFDGMYRVNSNNQVDEYTVMYSLCAALMLVVLCIWTIGYVRLKEKEA